MLLVLSQLLLFLYIYVNNLLWLALVSSNNQHSYKHSSFIRCFHCFAFIFYLFFFSGLYQSILQHSLQPLPAHYCLSYIHLTQSLQHPEFSLTFFAAFKMSSHSFLVFLQSKTKLLWKFREFYVSRAGCARYLRWHRAYTTVLHTKYTSSVMVLKVLSNKGHVMSFFLTGFQDQYLPAYIQLWQSSASNGCPYVFQLNFSRSHKTHMTPELLADNFYDPLDFNTSGASSWVKTTSSPAISIFFFKSSIMVVIVNMKKKTLKLVLLNIF